jgi:S-adenosylmethionine-diacylgycerolhomoserine-N-methlytransferase
MSRSAEGQRKSSWTSDLRVIWHLIAHPVRGKTHAERLESFYGGQADDYDSFRARMLHGRDELIDRLQFPQDGVWVDMGAGTGENVLRAGDRAKSLRDIHLVDLSESLLKVAEKQLGEAGVENAHVHLADATRFDLPDESVDLVTFSYSLTMIPDWFEAVLLAERMLKPGGTIAVTDFYVSRKYAADGQRQHGWLRRNFWTLWFGSDNVYLNGDHAAMLHRHFQAECFEERLGKVPYLPFIRAPYYLFIGTKPV